MLKTLVVSLALCLTVVQADRLVIEKIECKRVATGIDSTGTAGFGALGGIIAGGATIIAGVVTIPETGGGSLPVTWGALGEAAAGGATGAVSALKFIDGFTSGEDQLTINVNGVDVYDHEMEAGDVQYPEVSVEFETGCEIQLVERDSVSDNDDMGHINVDNVAHDKTAKGKDYRMDEALILSLEEGSLYLVTFRVERSGSKAQTNWALCGTAACKECSEAHCSDTSNDNLDRDGDYEDLRNCPYPMVHSGWKEYWMMWPLDNLYLRICKHPSA